MTLSTSLAKTSSGNKHIFSGLVTALSNDTTDPINSPAIDIQGLDVAAIAMGYAATGAATSTTEQLLIQGSIDGGNTWMTLVDTSGNNIATSAAVTGGASATAPVGRFVETESKSVKRFPFTHVRAQLDQGVTAGFTGTINAVITTRNNQVC